MTPDTEIYHICEIVKDSMGVGTLKKNYTAYRKRCVDNDKTLAKFKVIFDMYNLDRPAFVKLHRDATERFERIYGKE